MKPYCTAALILALSQCGLAAPPEKYSPSSATPLPINAESSKQVLPADVEVIRDVVVGSGGERPLRADVYFPKTRPADALPAVIFIHGGAWRKGSYQSRRGIPLAQHGYVAVTIEYRLSSEAKWPAQIEDCKLAVRWLRANAAKYQVNPDRIGVWGISAGGHLAACLGVMGDQPQFEGAGGYPKTSSAVQAVADFSGPADFTSGGESVHGGAKILGQLFGVSYAENTAPWKQASPIIYAKKDVPPFLVIHGDADKAVRLSQFERLVAALRAAEAPVEFITVPGGEHDLLGAPGGNERLKALLAFFDRTLKK